MKDPRLAARRFPFPSGLIKEVQAIIRDVLLTLMQGQHDALHSELTIETERSPTIARIAGAAALHGFTFKDVKFLVNPTVIEILFEETDRTLRIEF